MSDEFQVDPETEAVIQEGQLFATLKGSEEYVRFEAFLDEALERSLMQALSASDPVSCFAAMREASSYLVMRGKADGAISEGSLAVARVREAYEKAQRTAAIGPQGVQQQQAADRRAASGFGRPANTNGLAPRFKR